jgi:hypothetical protein
MQGAVRGLRDLAVVLPALVLLLLLLSVGLSPGRRSRALVAAGIVGITAGIVALLVRSIVGAQVVDTLVRTEAVHPAASAAWSILTSVLVDVAVGTIFIGALVVLAGLIAGHAKVAVALRRTLAPYLRDRPDLVFGATGVLLLLFFLWGPIQAAHKLVGILLIACLTLLGVELLRRQAAAEFPAAHYLPERDGLRNRAEDVRELLARRSSRLLGGVAAVGQGGRSRSDSQAAAGSSVVVDEIERLAALHASGALSDEEFAAAKRKLLALGQEPG